jgi:hypothetical protein
MMQYTETHAITITLKPNNYIHDSVIQQGRLELEILKLRKDKSLKLSLICELTQSSNIHCHGIIQVIKKDINKSDIYNLNNTFRRLEYIGFVCIKPITTLDDWLKYCTKDTPNKDIRYPIIVDDFEVFTHKCKFEVESDVNDVITIIVSPKKKVIRQP